MDKKTRIGLIISILFIAVITVVLFSRQGSDVSKDQTATDDQTLSRDETATHEDGSQQISEQNTDQTTDASGVATTTPAGSPSSDTTIGTGTSPSAPQQIGAELTPQQKKAQQIVEGYRKKVGGSTPFVKRGQKIEDSLSHDQLPAELANKLNDPTKLTAADLKKLEEARKELTKPKPVEKVSACYTTSFKHKTYRSIMEIEASTEYKNLLVIQAPNKKPLAQSSVCIRVNGIPVKHQRIKSKPNYFIIAPLADAKSKITATYCTGTSRCSEGCKIPKDDFMEAIGGITDELGDQTKYVAWDIADTKNKPSKEQSLLDVELKTLRGELVGSKAQKTKIYSGWKKKKDVESCSTNNRTTRVSKLD